MWERAWEVSAGEALRRRYISAASRRRCLSMQTWLRDGKYNIVVGLEGVSVKLSVRAKLPHDDKRGAWEVSADVVGRGRWRGRMAWGAH